MIVERTNNEILVRLPASLDLSELQSVLGFIKFKEVASHSKAKQKSVDKLLEEVNQSIWERFKANCV